jgi:hypothetical protein
VSLKKRVYRNELGVGYDYRLGRRSVRIRICVCWGDTYKSGSRVEKVEAKAPVVQVTPVVKGPVVREPPLEK